MIVLGPCMASRYELFITPSNLANASFQSQWFLVCVSLYTSAFICGLDSTVAADIQAPIIKTFENVDQLTWIGTGFPLGSFCAILPT